MENTNQNPEMGTESIGVTEMQQGKICKECNMFIGITKNCNTCKKFVEKTQTEMQKEETIKEIAIKEIAEINKLLETETNKSVRYNMGRRIGDLDQYVINAKEETEMQTSKGCGETCKVSQLTDETFVCGETKLNGKIWYCNDCLTKLHTRYDKVAHCANCGELAGLKGDLCDECIDKQEAN